MRTLQEYQRHAEECEALAKKALSPEQREAISQMANTWRMLADQRRSKLVRRAVQPSVLDERPEPPQNDDD